MSPIIEVRVYFNYDPQKYVGILGSSGVSGWTLLRAASKSSFWNDKNPDQWSTEERTELMGIRPGPSKCGPMRAARSR